MYHPPHAVSYYPAQFHKFHTQIVLTDAKPLVGKVTARGTIQFTFTVHQFILRRVHLGSRRPICMEFIDEGTSFRGLDLCIDIDVAGKVVLTVWEGLTHLWDAHQITHRGECYSRPPHFTRHFPTSRPGTNAFRRSGQLTHVRTALLTSSPPTPKGDSIQRVTQVSSRTIRSRSIPHATIVGVSAVTFSLIALKQASSQASDYSRLPRLRSCFGLIPSCW